MWGLESSPGASPVLEKEARHMWAGGKQSIHARTCPRKKGFQKRKPIRNPRRRQQQEGKANHVFLSKSILIRIECRIQRSTAELKVGAPDSRRIALPAALLAQPGQSRGSWGASGLRLRPDAANQEAEQCHSSASDLHWVQTTGTAFHGR